MRYEKLLALLMFLAAAVWASPQPLAANKTWSGNFPKTGSVTIPAGDVVTLDTNVALTDLTVNGQLICADKNLTVSSGWIMVHGLLQCGTAAAPYTKRLDLTLTGSNTSLDVMGMGAKFLGAMGGGRIVLAGENRLGWTRLAATANKGSLVINLKVAPAWRVGDRIVVTSTDFHYEHAEERTISAIAGTAVTLDKPLQKQHWCATEMFNGIPLEECAEVGLLTRNIRIQGDAYSTTSGFGGHIMIMAGAKAKISGVELYHMGQKGRVARYPMHWHMVGDATGQYMNNSSVVHSYNRFITIHGTHNTQARRQCRFRHHRPRILHGRWHRARQRHRRQSRSERRQRTERIADAVGQKNFSLLDQQSRQYRAPQCGGRLRAHRFLAGLPRTSGRPLDHRHHLAEAHAAARVRLQCDSLQPNPRPLRRWRRKRQPRNHRDLV